MLELPVPNDKKAQISLEFLIVYSFVLIIFIIMFALIATQRAATLVQQQYSLLQSQAQTIATYINQAVSSGNGYSATLPLLGGFITHSYNISISSTGVIMLGTKSGTQPITAYAFSNAKNFVINGTLLQSANGISIYQLQTYKGSISIYNSKGIIYINQQPVSTANLAQGMLTAQQADVKTAQFNGASSYVLSSTGPNLNYNPVTLAAWVYPTTPCATQCQYLIGKSAYGGFIASSAGNFFAFLNANPAGIGIKSPIPSYNQWYYIVETYDGSTLKLYVNGIPTNSQAASVTPVATSGIVIGTCLPPVCGAGNNQYFSGSIADVQIYNIALTSGQIAALYANGLSAAPILPSNNVGWWPLNGNANDYSGNSNHGTPNSITYQSVLQLSTRLVPASNSLIKPIAGFVASSGSFGSNGPVVVNYTDSNSVAHAFLSSNGAVGSGTVAVDFFNGNTSTESNLVGWWPLDTGYGNVAYDISGKYNNGVLTNVAWSSANQTDFAVASFPGDLTNVGGSNTQDGFITVNSAPSLLAIGINSTFTAVGWIYYKGPTAPHCQGIFGDSPNWPPTGAGFQLVGSVGNFGCAVLYVNGSSVPFPSPATSFPANSWEMVTAQYNGSSGLANVYLNNTLFASGTLAKNLGLTQLQPLYIGDDAWQSTGYDTFNGLITNMQLYSAYLTQNQIAALYAQGPASTPLGDSGLVSWWPLAGNAKDYSSNNNTGTAQYNVTFKNGNYTNSFAAKGQSFAYFNGQSDYVSIPSLPALQGSNGPFTISLWFKKGLSSAYETVIVQNEQYATSGFRLGFACGATCNTFQFWTTESGGTMNLQSPFQLSLNTWYHAVVVYSNQAAVLYINGVNVAQAAGTYIGSQRALTMGSNYGGYNFNGSIADVQIYNTALTPQQVMQLYAQGLPPQSRLNVSFG